MLLILEIAMLVAGLYALIKGKVPSFIVGGSHFEVKSAPARVMGLIMMLPIPATFVLTLVLAFVMGASGQVDQSTLNVVATALEIVLVVLAGVVTLILFYVFRKPIIATDAEGNPATPETNIEVEIARKTNGSALYVLLGLFGVTGLVLCPLAYIRTTEALRMIDEHHMGEKYRGRAKAVRIGAILVLGGWLTVTAFFFGFILLNS